MTSEDYFNWAAEYRQEVEAIEHLISVKEQRLNSTLKNIERMTLEKSLSNLFEQRIQCLGIAKELEERARIIREKEGRYFDH